MVNSAKAGSGKLPATTSESIGRIAPYRFKSFGPDSKTARGPDKHIAPKVCANCGGFLPAGYDHEVRQYIDHSMRCNCGSGGRR